MIPRGTCRRAFFVCRLVHAWLVPCRRDEGAGFALLCESGVGEVVRARMPCSAAWHEEQGGYLRSLCSEDCGLNAGKCCARTVHSAAFFAGGAGAAKMRGPSLASSRVRLGERVPEQVRRFTGGVRLWADVRRGARGPNSQKEFGSGARLWWQEHAFEGLLVAELGRHGCPGQELQWLPTRLRRAGLRTARWKRSAGFCL